MSGFGPLTELERDLCLLEDVVSDANDAWAIARNVPMTPRSVDRMRAALNRAHEVDSQLRALRVGMHQTVKAVEKFQAEAKAVRRAS